MTATMITPPMDFSDALYMLKQGKRMVRFGWSGGGAYIQLQGAKVDPLMTLPYIFMATAEDHFVPWVASQTDLLSNDWEEVQHLKAVEL